MNNDIVGPRGKRVLYSKPFHGFIHRDYIKDIKEFKYNCYREGIHMNYDGKKKDCGWSILVQQGNKIKKVFIPIAEANGIDVNIFTKETLDRVLKNISRSCVKNDPVKEISSFRKETINKIVPDIIEIKK